MSTTEILNEINRLPVEKRYKIIEQALKSIQETTNKNSLEIAVGKMLNEYVSDKEVIVFTNLDFDNFYETK